MQILRLTLTSRRNQTIVKVLSLYDKLLVEKINQIEGIQWSRIFISWSFKNELFKLHTIFESFKKIAHAYYSKLKKDPIPSIVNNKHPIK